MKSFAHLLGLSLAASTAMTTFAVAEVTPEAVIAHYVDIAEAKYGDALSTAKALDAAIEALLASPTDETLQAARTAWLAARVPYQQSEVYRFGNPIVDDWEGRVNSWPLDEGLIDYVDASYGSESDENTLFTANVIANPSIEINGKTIDAGKITPELISTTLQEAGGIEANVASGYHAIEFMLWGQDLNGNGPGAGNRPATDYSLENCTHGNCERRRDYLGSASDLLVADLEEMAANWKAGGAARLAVEQGGVASGLSTILTGMGSLSYGELAGERMKLGLLLGDPEEEHDCFSDNTHWSHYYDAKGIKNVYLGEYDGLNGTNQGASLSGLVKAVDPALDKAMRAHLNATEQAMQAMVDEAKKGNTVDVLIGADNPEGNAVMQNVVDALVAQTQTIEKIIVALNLDGIELEGSDSLDNPGTVM